MSNILKTLEEYRIFSVKKAKTEGVFIIQEECDAYFRTDLSADELAELGKELIAMAKAN